MSRVVLEAPPAGTFQDRSYGRTLTLSLPLRYMLDFALYQRLRGFGNIDGSNRSPADPNIFKRIFIVIGIAVAFSFGSGRCDLSVATQF